MYYDPKYYAISSISNLWLTDYKNSGQMQNIWGMQPCYYHHNCQEESSANTNELYVKLLMLNSLRNELVIV